MASIQDQDQGYRRGLVLGLTMAEIAILVIFVLLLVLGGLFARQAKERDALRQQVNDLESAVAVVSRLASRLGKDPEVIVRALAQAEETQRQLVLIQEKADRLTELEKAVGPLLAVRPPEQPLPEFFRELVLMRDVITDAGVAPVPEAVRQELVEAARQKEALSTMAGKDTAAIVKENVRLARDVENLRAQMANLRRQAKSGGRGLDHPPCWATPDGRPEYIFDVALTAQGLVLRDRSLPHRSADRAELPLSGFVLGEELAPQRFLAMTAPLFEWSKEHECRFVVRAFDTTGATQKAVYKRHMRVLENRFYKYEVIDERF